MAQVTVDVSEYDNLRDSLKESKKRVEELNKTIKDLKNGSKVIFHTKYMMGDVDGLISYIDKNLHLPYLDRLTISRILRGFFNTIPRDTYQYVNFKDVEAQVEAGLCKQKKAELEAAIAYYKKAAQELEEKNAGLEEEYQKEKKAYENASKFQIDQLNAEIMHLNDKITELRESKNEKIAKLIKQIDEAGIKLSELRGCRKNWFDRIFK